MAKDWTPPHVRQRRIRRLQRLRDLGYRDYSDYLASPHWGRLKVRYRASSLPQDCFCGETDGLHLHHKTYERIGDESLSDLVPLCARCHMLVHVLERRGDLGLDLEGLIDEARAAANNQAERARRQKAQSDFDASHDRAKAETRQFRRRFQAVFGEAIARGVDVSAELAECSAALDAAIAKVNAAE